MACFKMAASFTHWREASAIILVAMTRVPFVTSFQTTNFGVLMVKRSGKSKYLAKNHVFPGGLADDADFSPEWLDLFDNAGSNILAGVKTCVLRGGPGTFMFRRERPPQFSKIPSELAFRICAIRETFEESGILLVRDVNNLRNQILEANNHLSSGKTSVFSDTIIQPWRYRIYKNAGALIQMWRELNVVPDVWSLCEWSNWLSPHMALEFDDPLSRKNKLPRQDAAFYVCFLDYIPHAVHDDEETSELELSSASLFLTKQGNGEQAMTYPLITELARLLNFTDFERLKTFAWERSAVRCQRYYSVPCSAADCFLYLLPGDELYPENPDLEGTKSLLKFPETRRELREKHTKVNRVELFVNEKGVRVYDMVCNVSLPDGQVNPVANFNYVLPLAKY